MNSAVQARIEAMFASVEAETGTPGECTAAILSVRNNIDIDYYIIYDDYYVVHEIRKYDSLKNIIEPCRINSMITQVIKLQCSFDS